MGVSENNTHTRRLGLYVFTRRRGANTAHTQMGRPTHEAPTREYTHKHTQTQTNAQRDIFIYGRKVPIRKTGPYNLYTPTTTREVACSKTRPRAGTRVRSRQSAQSSQKTVTLSVALLKYALLFTTTRGSLAQRGKGVRTCDILFFKSPGWADPPSKRSMAIHPDRFDDAPRPEVRAARLRT